MAQSKTPLKAVSHPPQSLPAHPTVSGRWLLAALAISVPAAAFCTWAVFCLLFWQGSWQLLYHPTSTVSRTPSSIGVAFDSVSLATTNVGVSQIHGWWISSPSARYTALYLHDQSGNLSDTLKTLAELHASGLNVLAFDYRGYGQSQFVHPSENSWRQDATSALVYLIETRHIDRHSIVIVGSGLGANLALELAAAHPDLAGVVLQSPIDAPVNVIFNDARSKLIPVRLLVRDRYDLSTPALALRMPSLWVIDGRDASLPAINLEFEKVNAPKTRVLLSGDQAIAHPLQSWLANLKN